MIRKLTIGVTMLSLLACLGGGDEDQDGLTNGEEKDLGTDPAVADSDGDGLSDGEEVNGHGSDPLAVDSDGDGYLDGDEVAAGSDPADEESGIYEGGWPFNPDKDSLEDPGWDGNSDVGDMLPRFKWVDQFGDEVDIYDFAGHGKPIVIDVSGLWCGWCREVAGWLEGDNGTFDSYLPFPERIEAGDIYYITIIDANQSGSSASEDDIESWYDDYPNEYIPILLDEDQQMADWLDITGYPTMILVEEDMTVGLAPNNYTDVFTEINARYEDGDLGN